MTFQISPMAITTIQNTIVDIQNDVVDIYNDNCGYSSLAIK